MTEREEGAEVASARTRGDRALVLGAAVFVTTGVFVPVALISATPDELGVAWRVTCGLMVWSALRLSWIIAVGQQRLFEFVFWLFIYVFMGLAPTYQLRSQLFPGTTGGYIQYDFQATTAWVVVAGVAAFEVGRQVAARFGRQDVRITSTSLSVPRTVTLTLVACLVCGYLIANIGLGALFSDRTTAFAARSGLFESSSTGVIVSAIGIWALLVGIHSMATLWVGSRKIRSNLAFCLLLVSAIILLLVYRNPVSSARYVVGVIVGSLFCMLGAFATSRRVRASLTGLIVALLFLFPVADSFRRQGFSSGGRSGFFAEYGSGDYDAFAQIANSLQLLNTDGSTGGRQFLGVLFFWFPRSLWSSKPEDTGVLLADYRGLSFRNLSAPLWSEFLVNGGVILMMLGFAVVGYAVRIMDRRIVASFSTGGVWYVAGSILPFYWLFVLRGSLLQAMAALAVIVVSLWFVRGSPSTAGRDGDKLGASSP